MSNNKILNAPSILREFVGHMVAMKLVRYGVIAFILTAPLIIYGIEIFSISIRISRLIFILILPALISVAFSYPKLIWRDKFFVLLLFPFLSYSFLSIAWADNTQQSIYRFSTLLEVYGVYCLIFYTVCLRICSVNTMAVAYVLSAVMPVGIAFWQLANISLSFSASEVPFSFALIPDKYERLDAFGTFPSPDGFSRVSSSFGEPNMFAGYLCSVLLVSLILNPTRFISKLILRLVQLCVFVALVIAISKSGLISLSAGLLLIALYRPKYLRGLFAGAIVMTVIVGILYMSGYTEVIERFVSATGHVEYMEGIIEALLKTNMYFGEGIGSIEYGTTHRFLLSRLYEGGIMGVLFCLLASITPFILAVKSQHNKTYSNEKLILAGAMLAIVVGLHLYDYFIHLFPWIIAGFTAGTFVRYGTSVYSAKEENSRIQLDMARSTV